MPSGEPQPVVDLPGQLAPQIHCACRCCPNGVRGLERQADSLYVWTHWVLPTTSYSQHHCYHLLFTVENWDLEKSDNLPKVAQQMAKLRPKPGTGWPCRPWTSCLATLLCGGGQQGLVRQNRFLGLIPLHQGLPLLAAFENYVGSLWKHGCSGSNPDHMD